jgi:hypothetical protein
MYPWQYSQVSLRKLILNCIMMAPVMHPCRQLLSDYNRRKTAGSFEVARPKNTREMAHHTHNLVKDLCGVLVTGQVPETWDTMLQQGTAAPRPTATELEEQARAALRPLQEAIEHMEGAGEGQLQG